MSRTPLKLSCSLRICLKNTMSENIRPVGNDSKLEQILNRYYLGKRSHYVEVGPEKILLTGTFEKYYQRIKSFEVRDDDVFTLGFMKSGSRWTQEMVWLIVNDLDFTKACDVPLYLRSPLLEFEALIDNIEDKIDYFYQVSEMASPRCLRSHLHWSLLPDALVNGTKQAKIISILREPEDVCVSYYHHAKVIDGYTGSWENYCELFLGGKVPFGPYWKYVINLWDQRHNPNVMIIEYSKMRANLPKTIKDVAAFLNKSLSDEDVEKMCEHLKFDNLKNNRGFNNKHLLSHSQNVNPFVRSGKVGDYKNAMTNEMMEEFNKQKEHYFTEYGFRFGYSI